MPPLNFDDTLGVAALIAAAGAPKAAETYPRFPRLLEAIRTELYVAQEERLSFSQSRSIRRADLARRVAEAKFKDDRRAAEEQLAEFDASTSRRMAEFAERTSAANARMDTDGLCAEGALEGVRETVGRGRRLHDVPLPKPPVLPAGLAASIEAKRAELIVNAERQANISIRPALASDLKAAISRAVGQQAEKGRPPFDPRIRGGRDPSKVSEGLRLAAIPGASNFVGDGGRSFFVWLLADQIEAGLHALVDEADLTGAMSDAERAAALAAVDAARLVLEREEEALIRMAEHQGMTIARRADVDPRAVLMVEVRE